MRNHNDNSVSGREGLSIDEACHVAGIGKTSMFDLLKAGARCRARSPVRTADHHPPVGPHGVDGRPSPVGTGSGLNSDELHLKSNTSLRGAGVCRLDYFQ